MTALRTGKKREGDRINGRPDKFIPDVSG